MRALILILTAILVACAAFAQGPGGYRTFGSPTGFGNVLAPGVGTLPPLTVHSGASFPGRLGATISGFPPYTGAPAGRARGGRAVPAVIPYAVPVYVGGYGWDQPYPYPQQPPVPMVAPQPMQPPAPPVVINQYFTPETARPVMHEYAPGSLPDYGSSGIRTYSAPATAPLPDPNEQRATIWLIAFKDGSIYPAIGYWVEDGTLHYITKDGVHNRASLDRIDRDFSEQLNRERNLEFKLPQAQAR